MMYLVDTDYVASYLLSRNEAVTLLDVLAKDSFAISLIPVGEIYEGIYLGRDPKRMERIFRRFLREADVLPLNRAIMRRFASIRGELRRQGLIIGDFDILIGATALHHSLPLVTRNLKHYERIPGLTISTPDQP